MQCHAAVLPYHKALDVLNEEETFIIVVPLEVGTPPCVILEVGEDVTHVLWALLGLCRMWGDLRVTLRRGRSDRLSFNVDSQAVIALMDKDLKRTMENLYAG